MYGAVSVSTGPLMTRYQDFNFNIYKIFYKYCDIDIDILSM